MSHKATSRCLTVFKAVSVLLLVLFLASCENTCRVVRETYPGKKPKLVCTYTDCVDTNTYLREEFYENGQKMSIGSYLEGREDGAFKTWSEKGVLTGDWHMSSGLEQGESRYYYDNGKPMKFISMRDGSGNGMQTSWYENGEKDVEGKLSEGLRLGDWKYWRENGSFGIARYEGDSLWGPIWERMVDSAGIVTIVCGQYENGKQTGTWSWFDADSVLSSQGAFIEGLMQGQYQTYHRNGVVSFDAKLVDGLFDGEAKRYDANGKLTYIEIYSNDMLIGKRKAR